MSTINTTSDWGDQYDNQDVTLDGTSSPITVTVKAVHYNWGTEGDSSNTNFHSNNMTVDGNVTLKGDGYLTVNNTVTNNSSLTIEATNFTIDGTLTGKTVTISNGGALTVGTLTAPITFGASPSGATEYNTLTVKNYAASGTLTLNNLSPRDKIIFDNGQITTLQWGDDGKTIVDQHGTVLANVTFAEGYDKDDYQFNGDVVTVTCFLSGSMIRTCNGDVAVEDLRIGDQIVAFDWKNKKDVLRPVVWVGKARATVRPGLHDDEAGYPVRVLKDAVSDGVPYKDMLITAEHCLFFKGKFVPVRMLVNGASIFYDKSITSYDYYHVETEQHSVITADGMLTESYLDTGNRSSFRQEGRVVALHGTARTWEKDAGAPLCVDRAFVEPLFRMLEWREDSVAGCQTSANAPALTQDPDLHLVTETDAVIRPMRKAAHHYSFMLPPGTQSVRIVSRTSRPADVTGPFVDDRRSMGVAVADIHLFCAKSQHDISAHRQAVKPAGWYPSDGAQCVWTNGNAELPLGDYLTEGKMGILSLQILAAGPYIIRAEETAETQVKTA